MHNYTIEPTNWDYKEVSVINSLRGDAVTRIVYRRTDGQTDRRTDRRTDGQTDNGVSHKLDWSRPVELIISNQNIGMGMNISTVYLPRKFPDLLLLSLYN